MICVRRRDQQDCSWTFKLGIETIATYDPQQADTKGFIDRSNEYFDACIPSARDGARIRTCPIIATDLACIQSSRIWAPASAGTATLSKSPVYAILCSSERTYSFAKLQFSSPPQKHRQRYLSSIRRIARISELFRTPVPGRKIAHERAGEISGGSVRGCEQRFFCVEGAFLQLTLPNFKHNVATAMCLSFPLFYRGNRHDEASRPYWSACFPE